MSDWFDSFSEYGDFKDIAEVLKDVKKLRSLYGERRFDEMYQHIRLLVVKYPIEALTWNSVNGSAPRNEEEAFTTADEFLRRVVMEKVGKLKVK